MRPSETLLSLTGANGREPPVRKRLGHQLPPDTLEFLIAALKTQWKRYRKQLSKCQRKFSERSVHDLRVSARRLLSLLDLLSPFVASGRLKKAQEALKKHLDTFDELRDTQVQLLAVRKFREEFPAARCFYQFLKKRERRLRRSTCKKARRLRSKPLSKLMDAARDDVKECLKEADWQQVNPLLFGAVDRAFTLASRRKERIEPEDTHSIHCTRVAFKKFRYVIESLQNRLSWATKALLAKMRDYQTLMGDIQDAEVLLRGFQKFRRKKQRPDIPSGLNFEPVLQERRQRLIRKFLASADQLLEFWTVAGELGHVRREAAVGNGRHDGPHERGATRSMTQKKSV
jgi:CHAD domain-containing protein